MFKYDEETNTFFLFGSIDNDVAGLFAETVYGFLNNKPKDGRYNQFTVIISTTGGCVTSGIAIIDLIGMLKKVTHVTTVGLGQVSSMGLNIFLAGDSREMGPNTCFLYHGISGTDTATNHDARRSVEWWESVEVRLDKLFIGTTTFTMEELEGYRKESSGVWFTAEEMGMRLRQAF